VAPILSTIHNLNSTCISYLAYRCCSGFTALLPPHHFMKFTPQQFILLEFGFELCNIAVYCTVLPVTDIRHRALARMTHSRPGPPRYGTPAAPAPFRKMVLACWDPMVGGSERAGGGHLHV
jgi:hypothetical protein